jgi:hypothetical protein
VPVRSGPLRLFTLRYDVTDGHVGFTGTQRGMTPNQLSVVRFYLDPYEWVHHGDCIGADAQFHQAARRKGHPVDRHPPDNPSKRAFCDFDRDNREKPYLDRNHDIVDASSFMIVAPGEMQEQLRSGTWATFRYARKTGTKWVVVFPDGSTAGPSVDTPLP